MFVPKLLWLTFINTLTWTYSEVCGLVFDERICDDGICCYIAGKSCVCRQMEDPVELRQAPVRTAGVCNANCSSGVEGKLNSRWFSATVNMNEQHNTPRSSTCCLLERRAAKHQGFGSACCLHLYTHINSYLYAHAWMYALNNAFGVWFLVVLSISRRGTDRGQHGHSDWSASISSYQMKI